MNPRELLILLLGLAIVAVVLRGLYVAIQARRGQIRLAIDKNIPRDVDLDALEMAELPSGGARVKPRSGEHQEANAEVQRAAARADAMDLGAEADDAVPVLMDAVQVRSQPGNAPEASFEDGLEDDFNEEWSDAEDEHQTGELAAADQDDWAESEQEQADWAADDFEDGVIGSARTVAVSGATSDDEDAFDENPDDVLLDYETDGLSALAPDYQDAGEELPETEDSEQNAQQDAAQDPHAWQDEPDDEDSDAFQQAVAASQTAADDEQVWASGEQSETEESPEEPQDSVIDGLADDDEQPEPQLGSFDDTLEEFSMSAGERIGYEGKPRSIPARQTGLFDAVDDDGDRTSGRTTANNAGRQSGEAGSKRKSLFAGLWRKKSADKTRDAAADKPAERPVNPPPEPADSAAFEQRPEPRRESVTPPAPETTPEYAPRSAEVTPLDTGATAGYADEFSSATRDSQPDRDQSIPVEPSEVLVINVMASHGREFAGDDLMHVLITSGLKFGDMNIFHQRLGNQPKGPVVFSVANMLNPGTFDLNKMDSFRTRGVSLFLALPTAINNLDAFEKMLTVARQLCDALGGELKDDQRNGMTAQTIEHYRQRIRDFELRQLKAAGSRG